MNAIIKIKSNLVIAEVSHELGRYLRSLFFYESCIKLQRPSNKEHITLISQYENPILKISRTSIKFELIWELYSNGNAFWMPIISDDIEQIRFQCSLERKPKIPLHLCIGYISENKMYK